MCHKSVVVVFLHLLFQHSPLLIKKTKTTITIQHLPSPFSSSPPLNILSPTFSNNTATVKHPLLQHGSLQCLYCHWVLYHHPRSHQAITLPRYQQPTLFNIVASVLHLPLHHCPTHSIPITKAQLCIIKGVQKSPYKPHWANKELSR